MRTVILVQICPEELEAQKLVCGLTFWEYEFPFDELADTGADDGVCGQRGRQTDPLFDVCPVYEGEVHSARQVAGGQHDHVRLCLELVQLREHGVHHSDCVRGLVSWKTTATLSSSCYHRNKPGTAKVGAISKAQNCKRGAFGLCETPVACKI